MPKVVLKFEAIETRTVELQLTEGEYRNYEKIKAFNTRNRTLSWQEKIEQKALEDWGTRFEESLRSQALQVCDGIPCNRETYLVDSNNEINTLFWLVSTANVLKLNEN